MDLLQIISQLDTTDKVITAIIIITLAERVGLFKKFYDATAKLYADLIIALRNRSRKSPYDTQELNMREVRLEGELQEKVTERSQQYHREERLFRLIEESVQDRSKRVEDGLEELASKSDNQAKAINGLTLMVEKNTAAVQELTKTSETSTAKLEKTLERAIDRLDKRTHYLGASIRELAGAISELVDKVKSVDD